MDVRDLSLQTRHPSQATWPSVVTGNGICTQVPIKSPLLHPLPFFPRYCPPRRSEPWEGSTDISRLAPRNRGAKQGRLCGLLGPISLLSPE